MVDEGRGRWLRALLQRALRRVGWNPDRFQRLLCWLLGHVPVHDDECDAPVHDLCLWCRNPMPFKAEPDPPDNVQAILADGTRIPLECVYLGVDGDRHVWRATGILPSEPVSLHIGRMPSQTAVQLAYYADSGRDDE